MFICIFSEVTIKQLRERLKEGEEKVEAVAEVTKNFTSIRFNKKLLQVLDFNKFL